MMEASLHAAVGTNCSKLDDIQLFGGVACNEVEG